MSSLDLEHMHEPPALQHLTNEEVETFRDNQLKLNHPVERHVKLVSEASAAVSGFGSRDGLIRQKIRSRKLMTTFNTKKQFNA